MIRSCRSSCSSDEIKLQLHRSKSISLSTLLFSLRCCQKTNDLPTLDDDALMMRQNITHPSLTHTKKPLPIASITVVAPDFLNALSPLDTQCDDSEFFSIPLVSFLRLLLFPVQIFPVCKRLQGKSGWLVPYVDAIVALGCSATDGA